MELFHLSISEREKLEDFIREYNEQLKRGIIQSDLTYELSITEFSEHGKRLLVAKEGAIAGLATYNLGELEDLLGTSGIFTDDILDKEGKGYTLPLSELPGLRTLNGSIAMYLSMIESFKKGTGRIIVQELMNFQESEGIFLEPVFGASLFFKKLGFQETGVYIADEEKPLLVWTKSGNY